MQDRLAFVVSYVRNYNIDPDIPEHRTSIKGQVRMNIFLDIVGSLMSGQI